MFTTDIVVSSATVLPITSFDLSQQRELFVKSWISSYQDYSLAQLRVPDLKFFLQQVFDTEEQDYFTKEKHTMFFHAVQNDKTIGYLSCNIDNNAVVYIRQWAMSPEFASLDLLRKLLFDILDYFSDVAVIYIDVRHIAQDQIAMLTELGFRHIDSGHGNNDSLLYETYQYVFSDKCGTCLCDYDDSAFEEDIDSDAFSELCDYQGEELAELCPYSLQD